MLKVCERQVEFGWGQMIESVNREKLFSRTWIDLTVPWDLGREFMKGVWFYQSQKKNELKGWELKDHSNKTRNVPQKDLIGRKEFYYSSAWSFFVVVHVQLFATPWPTACQASLSFIISWSLLKLYWVGDIIQPSCPLSSPSPPAFNLSQHQGLFQGDSFHIKWPKYWSFSFSITPSIEYSGLVSFRIDWLHLFAVQGILKSLL